MVIKETRGDGIVNHGSGIYRPGLSSKRSLFGFKGSMNSATPSPNAPEWRGVELSFTGISAFFRSSPMFQDYLAVWNWSFFEQRKTGKSVGESTFHIYNFDEPSIHEARSSWCVVLATKS